MKMMQSVLAGGMALAVAFAGGCGGSKSMQVEEQCTPCLGGSCKIPQDLAQSNHSGSRLGGRSAPYTAPVDTSLIKSVYRKLPLSGDQTPVIEKIKPAPQPEVSAMAGQEGHYNEVKLPGMAHEDQPEEQPFLVRSFNKSVWPGGVPLEAEVDPELLNF